MKFVADRNALLLPGLFILISSSAEAATTVPYHLTVRKVVVCGKTYSEIVAQTDDPRFIPVQETVSSEDSAESAHLPTGFMSVSALPVGAKLAREGAATLRIEHPLLPAPIPTGGGPVLENYCRRIAHSRKGPRTFRTNLVQVALVNTGTGSAAVARTQALPPSVSQSAVATPESAPKAAKPLSAPETPLVHLVLYSPGNQREAEELAARRTKEGLPSKAINVLSIPGRTAFQKTDPIPEECAGPYWNECYFSLTDPFPFPASKVTPDRVKALYGLISPSSGSPQQIPDQAGLIRAFLRAQKKKNRGLRYVVLMGNAHDIPLRVTARTETGAPYLGAKLSDGHLVYYMPTDWYYAETLRPWTAVHSLKLNPEDLTVAERNHPDKLRDRIFDEGGKLWGSLSYRNDTQALTRTFLDGYTRPKGTASATPAKLQSLFKPLSPAESQNLIAVGRIPDKVPGGISRYLDKLAAWDAQNRCFRDLTVISSDGMVDLADLNRRQRLYASPGYPMHFSGEGFAAGFLSPEERKSKLMNGKPLDDQACPAPAGSDICACYPAENDWRAFGTFPASLRSYQSNSSVCFQEDTAIAARKPKPYSGLPFAHPDPRDLLADLSARGFSMLELNGHGMPTTLAVVTSHFNRGSQRGIAAIDLPGEETRIQSASDDVSVQRLRAPAGQANGLITSASCNTAGHLGGRYGGVEKAKTVVTLAEALLTQEGGGTFVLMNHLEGWYGHDEHYNYSVLAAVHDSARASRNARVGDALILHYRNWLNQGLADRVLNREAWGDPAMSLGSRERECTQLPPPPPAKKHDPR